MLKIFGHCFQGLWNARRVFKAIKRLSHIFYLSNSSFMVTIEIFENQLSPFLRHLDCHISISKKINQAFRAQTRAVLELSSIHQLAFCLFDKSAIYPVPVAWASWLR
jgi:hypothetical protein